VSESVMALVNVPDSQVLGEHLTQASLFGLGLAIVVTLVLWRHKRLYEGGLNVAREAKRVTWPNYAETKSATKVVIVTTAIISLILFAFDAVFQRLTAMILGIDG